MPHLVSFQITDAGGVVRAMTIPVDEAALLNDIQAFTIQMGNLLDDVTGGRLTAAYVNYALDLSAVGVKAVAISDAKYWMAGRLGFSVTGSDYRTSIVIPAVHPNIADDNDVIANAGNAAAFIAGLLSGTNLDVTDKYNNVLAAFLSGKRVSRK